MPPTRLPGVFVCAWHLAKHRRAQYGTALQNDLTLGFKADTTSDGGHQCSSLQMKADFHATTVCALALSQCTDLFPAVAQLKRLLKFIEPC
jgi:hypothetical protein